MLLSLSDADGQIDCVISRELGGGVVENNNSASCRFLFRLVNYSACYHLW